MATHSSPCEMTHYDADNLSNLGNTKSPNLKEDKHYEND